MLTRQKRTVLLSQGNNPAGSSSDSVVNSSAGVEPIKKRRKDNCSKSQDVAAENTVGVDCSSGAEALAENRSSLNDVLGPKTIPAMPSAPNGQPTQQDVEEEVLRQGQDQDIERSQPSTNPKITVGERMTTRTMNRRQVNCSKSQDVANPENTVDCSSGAEALAKDQSSLNDVLGPKTIPAMPSAPNGQPTQQDVEEEVLRQGQDQDIERGQPPTKLPKAVNNSVALSGGKNLQQQTLDDSSDDEDEILIIGPSQNIPELKKADDPKNDGDTGELEEDLQSGLNEQTDDGECDGEQDDANSPSSATTATQPPSPAPEKIKLRFNEVFFGLQLVLFLFYFKGYKGFLINKGYNAKKYSVGFPPWLYERLKEILVEEAVRLTPYWSQPFVSVFKAIIDKALASFPGLRRDCLFTSKKGRVQGDLPVKFSKQRKYWTDFATNSLYRRKTNKAALVKKDKVARKEEEIENRVRNGEKCTEEDKGYLGAATRRKNNRSLFQAPSQMTRYDDMAFFNRVTKLAREQIKYFMFYKNWILDEDDEFLPCDYEKYFSTYASQFIFNVENPLELLEGGERLIREYEKPEKSALSGYRKVTRQAKERRDRLEKMNSILGRQSETPLVDLTSDSVDLDQDTNTAEKLFDEDEDLPNKERVLFEGSSQSVTQSQNKVLSQSQGPPEASSSQRVGDIYDISSLEASTQSTDIYHSQSQAGAPSKPSRKTVPFDLEAAKLKKQERQLALSADLAEASRSEESKLSDVRSEQTRTAVDSSSSAENTNFGLRAGNIAVRNSINFPCREVLVESMEMNNLRSAVNAIFNYLAVEAVRAMRNDSITEFETPGVFPSLEKVKQDSMLKTLAAMVQCEPNRCSRDSFLHAWTVTAMLRLSEFEKGTLMTAYPSYYVTELLDKLLLVDYQAFLASWGLPNWSISFRLRFLRVAQPLFTFLKSPSNADGVLIDLPDRLSESKFCEGLSILFGLLLYLGRGTEEYRKSSKKPTPAEMINNLCVIYENEEDLHKASGNYLRVSETQHDMSPLIFLNSDGKSAPGMLNVCYSQDSKSSEIMQLKVGDMLGAIEVVLKLTLPQKRTLSPYARQTVYFLAHVCYGLPLPSDMSACSRVRAILDHLNQFDKKFNKAFQSLKLSAADLPIGYPKINPRPTLLSGLNKLAHELDDYIGQT